MEPCEDCGCLDCECDHEAEGHECGECGYVPTWRELQSGTCPQCRDDRAGVDA